MVFSEKISQMKGRSLFRVNFGEDEPLFILQLLGNAFNGKKKRHIKLGTEAFIQSGVQLKSEAVPLPIVRLLREGFGPFITHNERVDGQLLEGVGIIALGTRTDHLV